MSRQTKSILKVLFGLSAFFIVFGLLRLPGWDYQNNDKRVEWTILNLHAVRGGIEVFKENEKRHPLTLAELIKYADENPTPDIWHGGFREYLTEDDGNESECSVLNGEGGFYYNPKTGELKVNLIKPLKHYLKYYFRSNRNDIPAEW